MGDVWGVGNKFVTGGGLARGEAGKGVGKTGRDVGDEAGGEAGGDTCARSSGRIAKVEANDFIAASHEEEDTLHRMRIAKVEVVLRGLNNSHKSSI